MVFKYGFKFRNGVRMEETEVRLNSAQKTFGSHASLRFELLRAWRRQRLNGAQKTFGTRAGLRFELLCAWRWRRFA